MNTAHVDAINVMQHTIKITRMAYLFPSKTEIKLNKPIKNVVVKFFITNLSTIFFSVGAGSHLIVSVRNGIYDYLDKDIGSVISYHGASYFLYRYIFNLKHLVTLFKQLSDFETFGKPNNLDQRNQYLNKISKIYIFYHTIVVSLMCMSTLLYVPQCKEDNIVKGRQEVCGLPFPTWLPFNFDYFPLKHIVYLYQAYTVLIVYQTAGVVSFCMLETAEHLVIRFNHVGDTFVEALKERNSIKRKEKFQNAVRYHQAVIAMASLFNKCFSPCMMVHISLTGPFIGVAGYTFLTKIPLDTLALLCGWTISTFIVCLGGQRLMEASTNIGNIIQRVNWYDLENEMQKDMLLVVRRSRKPAYLRAGPFGPITYATIVIILQTSYSYVTLLKQTM